MPRKRRPKTPKPGGATRREFLTGVTSALTGAAVAGGGLLDLAHAEGSPAGPVLGPGKVKIALDVNGRRHDLFVEPRATLLEVLREDLRLTGTKSACERGECGACTVHLDGEPIRSCVTPISAVAGSTVTTIEGLSTRALHPVQTAWIAEDVPQCGYCQSGQIMTAAALLAKRPAPTDAEIAEAMSGNLCRCGTYQRIRVAIHRAAALGRARG